MEATNGSALVRQEPMSERGILTREALKADGEQRVLLAEYIRVQMKDGSDFGVIPGTPRPTLLKPGAEKLVDLFRCTPKYVIVKMTEDFEKGFFNYIFRVRLTQRDSKAVLAEGFGSANSREGRYRWRNAQAKCPTCQKESLLQSKDKPEFFCWKKRGGCGATFPDKDARITSQVLGKVENDDIATMANTILKMAKKRALVDGAIALARCSDMFTQDVEDLPESEPPPPTKPPASKRADKVVAPAPAPEGQRETMKAPLPAPPPTPAPPAVNQTPEMRVRAKRIYERSLKLGWQKEAFREWIGLELGSKKQSQELTSVDLDRLEAAMTGCEYQPVPPEPGHAG